MNRQMAKSLNGENFIPKHNKRTTQGNGRNSRPKNTKPIVAKANVTLFTMIKSFVTGAAVIAATALAPLSAIAGPYFNPLTSALAKTAWWR